MGLLLRGLVIDFYVRDLGGLFSEELILFIYLFIYFNFFFFCGGRGLIIRIVWYFSQREKFVGSDWWNPIYGPLVALVIITLESFRLVCKYNIEYEYNF